jgi:hypothetical protein
LASNLQLLRCLISFQMSLVLPRHIMFETVGLRQLPKIDRIIPSSRYILKWYRTDTFTANIFYLNCKHVSKCQISLISD